MNISNFLSDKRYQLLATVGIPALYALANGIVQATAAHQLVIVNAQDTAIVVGILTLAMREVASQKEALSIHAEIAAPPEVAPNFANVAQRVQADIALLQAHKADVDAALALVRTPTQAATTTTPPVVPVPAGDPVVAPTA